MTCERYERSSAAPSTAVEKREDGGTLYSRPGKAHRLPFSFSGHLLPNQRVSSTVVIVSEPQIRILQERHKAKIDAFYRGLTSNNGIRWLGARKEAQR